MPKIIYNKYEKALIPSLPLAQFKGRIIVILTPGETRKAVRYLLSQKILGFDTETRPSFKKGLTPDLVELLEDNSVVKVGLSWHDDVNALKKIGDFNIGHFIDIQTQVHEVGIEDLSLQKLFANLFGQKISKRQQLSNWEADILDNRQKLYAATDAWACIQLYKELERLIQTKDYELKIKDETNTTETR